MTQKGKPLAAKVGRLEIDAQKMRAHTHIHTHMQMHTHIHTHMQMHTHTYTHKPTHTHIK